MYIVSCNGMIDFNKCEGLNIVYKDDEYVLRASMRNGSTFELKGYKMRSSAKDEIRGILDANALKQYVITI